AWRLAKAGLDVVVVDPSPGQGASRVAGGMLGATAETGFAEATQAHQHQVSRHAWDPFLADLSSDLGKDVGYETIGTLVVGLDASDLRAVNQIASFQASLGLAVEQLDRNDLDLKCPGLGRSVTSGWFLRDDGAIDNRTILVHLIEACRVAGVRFASTQVDEVSSARDGIRQLVTPIGICTAQFVILATGAARLPLLAENTQTRTIPQVHPVAGTIVRLFGSAAVPHLDHTVRSLVYGRPCYLVPRKSGSIVLGATAVERGYDLHVDAGGLFQLLEDGRRIFPALDDYAIEEIATGLRPTTDSHLPFVEEVEAGLIAALGHYRNGFLLAPATANRVVDLVLNRRMDER
ncbi:MAG: glycine oxidase ThiO, partial [Actinomycetota bacterium]